MQGVKQMKANPSIDARYVFIRPPSFEALAEELRTRRRSRIGLLGLRSSLSMPTLRALMTGLLSMIALKRHIRSLNCLYLDHMLLDKSILVSGIKRQCHGPRAGTNYQCHASSDENKAELNSHSVACNTIRETRSAYHSSNP